MAAAAMPVVGRIRSEGDLVISGAVTALYPVTAGGNISLANNGSLFAQSAPYQPSFRFPVQSTTDDSWLAMARSVGHSTILSGHDLPMSTFQAADINQMTAPVGDPKGRILTLKISSIRKSARISTSIRELVGHDEAAVVGTPLRQKSFRGTALLER